MLIHLTSILNNFEFPHSPRKIDWLSHARVRKMCRDFEGDDGKNLASQLRKQNFAARSILRVLVDGHSKMNFDSKFKKIRY